MRYAENAGARRVTRIHSYQSALDAAGHANRNGRIGHNTYIGFDGDRIFIRLHQTHIVTYYRDGSIKLDSGGHQTVTTKARMNEVLPPYIRVFQKHREWFVDLNGRIEDFYDGMTIRGPHPETNPPQRDRSQRIGQLIREGYPDGHGQAAAIAYRENPGKFDNAVDEMLYYIDHDQTLVDESGWYGLISGLLYRDAEEFVRDSAGAIDFDEFRHEAENWDWPMNAIVHESSDGFVSTAIYKNNRDAIRDWRELEENYGT